MGAGNVQHVFERYANRLPWRTFAALVYMAKRSVDADPWPYYSAGLDELTAMLYGAAEPTTAQQRDVRRLVRTMVDGAVVTKDREASSLRKVARDRPARYRLNIHPAADLARKEFEAAQADPSTGVSDPSTGDASTGVKHPSTEAPSTGVLDPSKHRGVSPPESPKHRGLRPLEGVLEPEEEEEEDARASDVEPAVPRRTDGTDQGPSPRCSKHDDDPTDAPCSACGNARRRHKAWAADREAAEQAWRAGVRDWMAWADRQPMCDCGQPGGNLVRPDTGDLRCPVCRKAAA